jgi:hypothetical protein
MLPLFFVALFCPLLSLLRPSCSSHPSPLRSFLLFILSYLGYLAYQYAMNLLFVLCSLPSGLLFPSRLAILCSLIFALYSSSCLCSQLSILSLISSLLSPPPRLRPPVILSMLYSISRYESWVREALVPCT